MPLSMDVDDCVALLRRVDHLEMQLREADHRIANSLQLASAVAGHEARQIEDVSARSRLLATQRYIEAIGDVHRLLSASPGHELLALDLYLARLVERLQSAVQACVSGRVITLRSAPCLATPQLAVWIGMVVIELVNNAFKYAYDAAESGEVRIDLLVNGGGLQIEVADDGRGMDEVPSPGGGLGARIIQSIARRLDARFFYSKSESGGVRAVFSAPTGALA